MTKEYTGFKRRNYNDILLDMQDRALDEFGDDLNITDNSPMGKLLKTVAWEHSYTWEQLEDSWYNMHLLYANGVGLDLYGSNFGELRHQGTVAQSRIAITGEPQKEVPMGFKVATRTGFVYETVVGITLNDKGYGEVDVHAIDIGNDYNCIEGALNIMVNPILGIHSVVNIINGTGGSDIETDDEYRDRLLFKLRTPLTGDNPAQYIVWAKEVSNVGGVKVSRATPKAGYTTLTIANSSGGEANEDLINNVTEYISALKPINAGLVVVSAKAKDVHIKVDVQLSRGGDLSVVQDNIEKEILNYLKKISMKEEYVSYAQIGRIILDTPTVIDYNDLTINGQPKNLELEYDETPLLKTVEVGEID